MSFDESQHPRKPRGVEGGGQFTHKAGVEGRQTAEKELYGRVLQPDGGFTYHPLTGKEPKDGFAVSIFPDRSWATDARELSWSDVEGYVLKNRDLFGDRSNFLGAWHDPETHRVYMDVSRVVRSSREAASLAQKYDQIAYFDLARGESVTVNRNATSGGVAP